MPLVPAADLRARLERRLPAEALAALDQAVAIAREMGTASYLVGGPVRDLLLDLPVDDLDLVLEGDAIAVAERFLRAAGGTLTRHSAFGTAKVLLDNVPCPFHVDFVTARAEEYPQPAALPVVRPSTIKDDLLRRDFTINTLAVRLDASPLGLLDLCGGARDLDAGIIRVLHDRSFVDDPTRILRGARFAARLGFMIEPHTRSLIVDAVTAGMIERTSPIRILHELWLALQEPAPEQVFGLLHDLGVLPHVLPGMTWTMEAARQMAALPSTAIDAEKRRLLGLALFVHATPASARPALLRHYPLSAAERRTGDEVTRVEQAIEELGRRNLRPSELDRLLYGLDDTAYHLADLGAPSPAREVLRHYRDVLRPTPPLLTGDDLRAMQIPPGPAYRTLLQGLRAAQLDGEVPTREEAEAWVRAHRA